MILLHGVRSVCCAALRNNVTNVTEQETVDNKQKQRRRGGKSVIRRASVNAYPWKMDGAGSGGRELKGGEEQRRER